MSGDITGVTYFHFPSVPELHSPQTDNAYLHYVGHFILLTKLRNSSAQRVLTIDLSLSRSRVQRALTLNIYTAMCNILTILKNIKASDVCCIMVKEWS